MAKKPLTGKNVEDSVKKGFNRSFKDKVKAFLGSDDEEEEEKKEEDNLGKRINSGLKKLGK